MASLIPGKEKAYIKRKNAEAWEGYIRLCKDPHSPKYLNATKEEREEMDRYNFCIWQECGGYGSPYWYEVFKGEEASENTKTNTKKISKTKLQKIKVSIKKLLFKLIK